MDVASTDGRFEFNDCRARPLVDDEVGVWSEDVLVNRVVLESRRGRGEFLALEESLQVSLAVIVASETALGLLIESIKNSGVGDVDAVHADEDESVLDGTRETPLGSLDDHPTQGEGTRAGSTE